MHRFFIDKVSGDKAIISDAEQLHHLRDVLRLKKGDAVALSDSAGNDYTGIVEVVGKKQAQIKVTPVKAARERTVKLTIACAIPKNTRFDDVVDFLTQLRVERIIPMRTERVVVKLDGARAEEKRKRWEKIARSAARQSQRSRIPVISPVMNFYDVIQNSGDYDLKLIPHLSGGRKLIKDVLAAPGPRNIIVVIGPEGDFTPEEVALALASGFLPVSLGDTVLRVATAAIAVTSYIKFALGD